MDLRKFALGTLFLILSTALPAQVKKGFEALSEYDFFKARKIFLKELKKNPAPAAFGLSKIHFDRLNHFHNLDSAFVRIVQSEYSYSVLDAKKRENLNQLEINENEIAKLKLEIYAQAYEKASLENTSASFDYFLKFYNGAPQLEEAMAQRNSLALEEARLLNTEQAYAEFLEKYPESREAATATELLDRVRFLNETADGKLESFENFILRYPASNFISQAQDAIYRLMAAEGTIDKLYAFVKKHPDNRNTANAWEQIYRLFTSDQKHESFSAFRERFPEYPFQEKISRDAQLSITRLFPVIENEKWGFADSTGKIIIPFKFDEAGFFTENLAPVAVNEKFGFVNKTGTLVIKPTFTDVDAFTNGLAIAETGEFSGIINTRGEWIVKPDYESITGPYSGVYFLRNKGKYFLYSSESGISPEVFDYLDNSGSGLLVAGKEGGLGYINLHGSWQIQPIFDEAFPFEDGRARVAIGENFGLIDSTGKYILKTEYDRISANTEGLYRIDKGSRCAFVNSDGEIQIPFRSDCAPALSIAEGFNEGLARISEKGKKGFMNSKGRIVIPPIFDEVGFFSSGLAPVKRRGQWGYINRVGKMIAEPQFEQVRPYLQDHAIVKKSGFWGLIGRDGNFLIPAEYDEIQRFESGYILTKNGSKTLVNRELVILLPFPVDEIRITPASEIVEITRNGKMAYFHLYLNRIFWQESGF